MPRGLPVRLWWLFQPHCVPSSCSLGLKHSFPQPIYGLLLFVTQVSAQCHFLREIFPDHPNLRNFYHSTEFILYSMAPSDILFVCCFSLPNNCKLHSCPGPRTVTNTYRGCSIHIYWMNGWMKVSMEATLGTSTALGAKMTEGMIKRMVKWFGNLALREKFESTGEISPEEKTQEEWHNWLEIPEGVAHRRIRVVYLLQRRIRIDGAKWEATWDMRNVESQENSVLVLPQPLCHFNL